MGIVQMVERGYVGLVDRGRVLKKWNVPRIFQLDSLSVYEKRKSSGGGGRANDNDGVTASGANDRLIRRWERKLGARKRERR